MSSKMFIIPALLLIAIVGTGCGVTTRDAEHTGYITAVERNGLIWEKGYAYVKTDLSSSQEDVYCVEDDSVYEKLKDASRNKQRVTVTYKSEAFVAPWRCERDTFITRVESR